METITRNLRAIFAASAERGIYVEGHRFYNLMTVCNFNGDLICNVFGRNWDKQYDGRVEQYDRIEIGGDRIFALYSGERAVIKNTRPINLPSLFLVFDINGNYIRSLETGYKIVNFCYDAGNNRILMCVDDDIRFAYLDLDGLV